MERVVDTEGNTEPLEPSIVPPEGGFDESNAPPEFDVGEPIEGAVEETTPAPIDSADIEHQHWLEVEALNAQIEDAEMQLELMKRDVKNSKKVLDGLIAQLRGLIARGPQPPEIKPPDPQGQFEFTDTEAEATEAYDTRLDTPVQEVLKMPKSGKPISKKKLETLQDAGVDTIGDFEQLRGGQLKDYPHGLRDLGGVGSDLITEWENNVLAWLAVTPQPAAEEQSEPAPTEDDGVEYADAK